MLAQLRQFALGVAAEARRQLALSPDLKHLDDGATRWHFGDDPQDLGTRPDEEW